MEYGCTYWIYCSSLNVWTEVEEEAEEEFQGYGNSDLFGDDDFDDFSNSAPMNQEYSKLGAISMW